MTVTCPYCSGAQALPGGEARHEVEACPYCRREFEVYWLGEGRSPVVMKLRGFVAKRQKELHEHESVGEPKAGESGAGGLEAGKVVGGYQIAGVLGRGGMGVVYRARQISLRRDVALKVLAPRLASRPVTVARFMKEAVAAGQLVHHHLVQVYDLGAEGAVRFFTMELVKGRSLGEVLKAEGALPAAVAAAYAVQAARGLRFAHARGLVHRDVKPGNLMVTDEGLVKVADLGLVKALAREAVPGEAWTEEEERGFLGTPAYAAPEQAGRGVKVDGRADVYGLGCTLYALLTGGPPFSGRSIEEIIEAHARRVAVPVSAVRGEVGDKLSGVVAKMMAKRPAERYADMGAVVAALEEYLEVREGERRGPKEEETRALAEAAGAFRWNAWAVARGAGIGAFTAACIAAGLVMGRGAVGSVGRFGALAAWAVFLGMTAGMYHLVTGLAEGRPVALWARYLLTGRQAGEKGETRQALPAVVFVAALVLWMCGWLGTVTLAVGASVGFAVLVWLIDQQVRSARAGAVARAGEVVAGMRRRGVDEDSVGAMVVDKAGRAWRGFGRAVLGEGEMVGRLSGIEEKLGRRLRGWREAAVEGAVKRLERQRARRLGRVLAGQIAEARARLGEMGMAGADEEARAGTESAGGGGGRGGSGRGGGGGGAGAAAASTGRGGGGSAGAVAGVSAPVARGNGRGGAGVMVTGGGGGGGGTSSGGSGPGNAAGVGSPAFSSMRGGKSKAVSLEAALGLAGMGAVGDGIGVPVAVRSAGVERKAVDYGRGQGERSHESYFARRFGSPVDLILGPAARLALAAVVLIGFVLWWQLNKGHVYTWAGDASVVKPLRIEWLPEWACDAWGSWQAAVAGGILLLSALSTGRVFAVLMMAASLAALFGGVGLGWVTESGWAWGYGAAAGLVAAAVLGRDVTE